MNKQNGSLFGRHFLLLLFIFALLGCANESAKEAINHAWDEEIEVQEVIASQPINEGTIIFFRAKDMDETDTFERLGVALTKKENNKGWKLLDSSINTIANAPFSVGHKQLHNHYDGGKIVEIPVAFGKLMSEDITTVKVKRKDEFKEVNIIATESGRYFYELDAWGPIKAIDKNGMVIDEY